MRDIQKLKGILKDIDNAMTKLDALRMAWYGSTAIPFDALTKQLKILNNVYKNLSSKRLQKDLQ